MTSLDSRALSFGPHRVQGPPEVHGEPPHGASRPARRTFGSIGPHGDTYRARYVGPNEVRYTETGFVSYDDADRFLHDVRGAISARTWIAPGTEVTAPDTFAKYANEWLRLRDLADRTRAEYRRLLDRFLIPAFGELTIAEINLPRVRNWWAGIDKAKATQSAHAYGLLRTIMGDACAEEGRFNPVRIRRAGVTARKRTVRMPSPAELDRLVEALPEDYKLMVRVTAWCGLRFGEAAALIKEDVIDLAVSDVRLRVQRAVVTIDGKAKVKGTKSGATRVVPVHNSVAPALLAHAMTLADGALLFPGGDGHHLDYWVLYRVWKAAIAEAGLDGGNGLDPVRFHDLRHLAGMTLTRAPGATPKDVMTFLGHSTTRAYETYQHSSDDQVRKLIDSV